MFTRLAIQHNRTTICLALALIISGLMSFYQLPKAKDPGFTIRTAVITTIMPGASPERIERLITDPLEKKIQEMPEVDSISSTSRVGLSLITVNFQSKYQDMRPIFDDLRRKVADAKSSLPAGVAAPTVDDEFGDVFGSVYAITGEGYNYAELKTAADDIRDRLLKEPDVAKVEIHGAQDEVIYIEYNNTRLTELGLSPQQLSQNLEAVNIVSSGGDIVSGRETITLEPTGNFESVQDLQDTVIKLPNNTLVYLRDIAKIYRAYRDPPRSIARVNGKPSLVLAISMREGGDILKLGKRLDLVIPNIQSSYPWGIDISKVWFQADLVKTNIDNFVVNLLQAVAIVMAVMIIFMGLRTGLVVGTLIPSAIISTFYIMSKFSITINTVSLAALIIALGLLVDNAIVMVESIQIKREQGMNAIKAAIKSGQELSIPLLVSSLTTAAAFMPIALAESMVGEFTSDIFYVVTITLLLSWCFALSVVPIVSVYFLKTTPSDTSQQSIWYSRYRSLLLWVLTHKPAFFSIIAVCFALMLVGMRFVPVSFIAPSEEPIFTVKLELPLGSSIATTEAMAKQVDQYINGKYFDVDSPKVANWFVFIGSGGPRFMLSLSPPPQNPANAFLIVNVLDNKDVPVILADVNRYLFDTFPDLSSQVNRLENGPPVGYPIQVRLSGPNSDTLYKLADQTITELRSYNGVDAVSSSWGLPTKKLIVDINQEQAQRSGVTSSDVAYSLRTSLSGIQLSEYREGNHIIPITLRTIASDRDDITKLDNTSVYSSATGAIVPLTQVADIRLQFDLGAIERRDRERTMTVRATLKPNTTANEVTTQLLPWLEAVTRNWPTGYRYELGGEADSSDEANRSIAEKLPLALIIILLLLIAQFNSIRKPLIILGTIPLGLIGVTIGLLLARSSMGFFTLLGIISLSGIIINNALVLIDRINIEIQEFDKGPHLAILDACQQRLRPIAMAATTTILGMMPMLWGGSAMFKPMAISIMFGLSFATLLTLLVVPVMYALLFGVSFKHFQK